MTGNAQSTGGLWGWLTDGQVGLLPRSVSKGGYKNPVLFLSQGTGNRVKTLFSPHIYENVLSVFLMLIISNIGSNFLPNHSKLEMRIK